MGLELIVKSPKMIGYREYTERVPVGDEVLVQTMVSGIKHGTELNIYRGTLPFADELWDPDLRIFRYPDSDEKIEPFFPHTLGSWAAGVVLEVGEEVTQYKPGDFVHGEWKHRTNAIKKSETLYPVPAHVNMDIMVLADPARFALAAIHDAAIKLGDRVAIFGLGAIGMIAVQMANLNGAGQIIAVDPIEERLILAQELGVDTVINPEKTDAGRAIKEATQGKGVDVAIDLSGVYSALQHAIRGVHKDGLVVTASYYGDIKRPIDLSREWHHNRVTLRSSMPFWDCAHRCYPMWNMDRVERTSIGLLADQKIRGDSIIETHYSFDQAADAYSIIDQSPGGKIKILLTYPQ